MKLILSGAGLMLAGLALLLAMVIRLIEPGLALSLFSYAGVFAGMLVGLAGVVRVARDRRGRPEARHPRGSESSRS